MHESNVIGGDQPRNEDLFIGMRRSWNCLKKRSMSPSMVHSLLRYQNLLSMRLLHGTY